MEILIFKIEINFISLNNELLVQRLFLTQINPHWDEHAFIKIYYKQAQISSLERRRKFRGESTDSFSLGVEDTAADRLQTSKVSPVVPIQIPVRVQEHSRHHKVSDERRRPAESGHQVHRRVRESEEIRFVPPWGGGDDVQQR